MYRLLNSKEKIMLENFLSNTHTDALIDKDFKEWHLGIPYYGFWAIVIEKQDYLARISQAQKYLQQFFLPGYARQPHITLHACGLMSEAYFSNSLLNEQIELFKSLNISDFEILLGHIDSFTTAPFFHINDASHTLRKINAAFSHISSDSKPDCYQPHITLGLYREKFKSKLVANEIKKFNQVESLPFQVSEIHFCRYETANIQGPIEIIKRIKF
jgi:2'-5' RNA ligase